MTGIIYIAILILVSISPLLIVYFYELIKYTLLNKKYEMKEKIVGQTIEFEIINKHTKAIEFKIKSSIAKKFENELNEWFIFLSTMINVLAFSFALAIQGTKNPLLNGSASIIFIILIYFTGLFKFPMLLKVLRKDKKNGAILFARLHLEGKYLGIKTLLKLLPAILLSFGFLTLSTISPAYNKLPTPLNYIAHSLVDENFEYLAPTMNYIEKIFKML